MPRAMDDFMKKTSASVLWVKAQTLECPYSGCSKRKRVIMKWESLHSMKIRKQLNQSNIREAKKGKNVRKESGQTLHFTGCSRMICLKPAIELG